MTRWLMLMAAALAACGMAPGAWAQADRPVALIVTHTTGYRHESIEPAAAAIAKMAQAAGLRVEQVTDPARFDRPLDGVALVALVSTTTRPGAMASEWLTGSRRAHLQAFVRGGGGVVGIHGAADSHYGWDWYGRMIGARFARHPEGTPKGMVSRHGHRHPAIRTLPDRFAHVDEWYWFDDYDPRLRPLLLLDPASIGEKGVNPRPLAWAHVFEGGRIFYTALGHTVAAWQDERVLAHVRGGLIWAARKPVTSGSSDKR